MKRQSAFTFSIAMLVTFFAGCATTSPLTTAINGGNNTEVKRLIKEGADINELSGPADYTPLMTASRQGNMEIVKELLEARVDVNKKNKYDDTALTVAAWKCHTSVVQALIVGGADVNARNTGWGSTPLMLASECDDIVSIKELLAKGANPNVTNKPGLTALSAASRRGKINAARILLEAGASVGPALYVAAEAGQDSIVNLLVEKGADVNFHLTSNGWTPLMIAAAERHSTTVAALIAAGADVNATNNLGRTALMFSAYYGDADITKQLLEHGAKIDIVPNDKEGKTALIASTIKGHNEIVTMLVSHGADVNIQDKNGKTALAYAIQQRDAAIARILRQAGAKE